MNKGKINNHTRNQKRMYRIHKQEELIEKQRYIIGDLQQRIDTAIEYISEAQLGEFVDFRPYYLIDDVCGKDLLKILKGEWK